MTLRVSDLQSDSDLDSIRNSCDVCNLSIQNITNSHANKRTLSQKSYILFGKTGIAFTKLEQIQIHFEHLWFSQTQVLVSLNV